MGRNSRRRRGKKTPKNREKTGEIIRISPVNPVNLCTQKEKVNDPGEFMGQKLLKGNELWRWDNLEDINFK